MGKAGRIFCIAVPLALTLISLVFLVMIGLGQTNKDSNYLSNLYYIKADLSDVSDDFRNAKRPANNETDDDAKDKDGNIKLYKFYTVGLWNYCAGDGDKVDKNDASFGQDSASKVDFCTGRQTRFAFDPEKAWGLDSSVKTRFFSDKLDSALDKYRSGFSKVIGPAYILTVVSAGVTALVSIAAIFSRLGSCATTIAASITSTLAFIFAVVTTAAYGVLAGALNGALDSEGISFKLGPTMFIYMWLVAVASFAATLFWSLSSCCCSGSSGRSSKKEGKGKGGRWGPFGGKGYQNLHGGEQGYPMHNAGGWSGQGAQAYHTGHGSAHPPQGGFAQQGGAYEPYRHS